MDVKNCLGSILLIHYILALMSGRSDKVRIKNELAQIISMQITTDFKLMTSNLVFRKTNKSFLEAGSLTIQAHVSKSDTPFHFLTLTHTWLFSSARLKNNSTLQWTITNINGKIVSINNNSWSKLFHDWISFLYYNTAFNSFQTPIFKLYMPIFKFL